MWRAVGRDGFEGQPDKPLGELARIADGCRGEYEAWVRPVRGAETPETAHHLGDVRAEDSAIDVGFVQHDVTEMVQELGPALVRRQDAQIAEQDGSVLPDLAALLLGRVPVVDRRHGPRHPQRSYLPHLVLGQRLGGVQEQRPCLTVLGEGVQGRQRETE